MGIFDGASQKQMSAQQMQIEIEQDKIRSTLFNQAQQIGIANNQAAMGLIQPGAIGSPITSSPRFNPNEVEAYQIPLSQLVAMWQVKYGDEWVDTAKPYDGGFYAHACRRLSANKMLEIVEGWARLKENVEKLLADR